MGFESDGSELGVASGGILVEAVGGFGFPRVFLGGSKGLSKRPLTLGLEQSLSLSSLSIGCELR